MTSLKVSLMELRQNGHYDGKTGLHRIESCGRKEAQWDKDVRIRPLGSLESRDGRPLWLHRFMI